MAQGKPGRRHNPPPPPRGSGRPRPIAPTPGLALLALVLITLLAYANAWPNNLTFDDRMFAGGERFAGMGWSDLGRFFTEELWAATGVGSHLYRPLMLVFMAVQSWLFGDWLVGYHLVNILLHVLVTVAVFGLVAHVLRAGGSEPQNARWGALLAAVVFGVHPIHTEVVNSVFNGSEMLASLGVAGGLWWFLRTRENAAFTAWLGLGVVYLLALLCRESAASLPALAVALLWLTDRARWTLRLRKALPALWLLVPLLIYLALRTHALEQPAAAAVESASQLAAEPAPAEPATDAARPADTEPWWAPRNLQDYWIAFRPEQALLAAGLWLESLRIMVWPHPLQIYYDPPDTNPWVAAMLQLTLLGLALLAYLKQRPGLLIGLAFFYLAILPSSQVFGQESAAPGLADRILYLPSVGLTIALAAGLCWLLRRFGPRIAVATVAVISLALVPLTWARNAEWINDVVLAESTYQRLDDKDSVLDTLIAAHLREGSLQRAVELCDTHGEGWPPGRTLGVHCGSAYGRTGRLAEAEKAFLSATHHPKSNPVVFAHINLAMLYVHLGRRAEAVAHFEQANAREKRAFRRAYFSALMLIQMFPEDRDRLLEARTHLERALALQPRHAESRAELAGLNARLASLDNKPGD